MHFIDPFSQEFHKLISRFNLEGRMAICIGMMLHAMSKALFKNISMFFIGNTSPSINKLPIAFNMTKIKLVIIRPGTPSPSDTKVFRQ